MFAAPFCSGADVADDVIDEVVDTGCVAAFSDGGICCSDEVASLVAGDEEIALPQAAQNLAPSLTCVPQCGQYIMNSLSETIFLFSSTMLNATSSER